MGWEEHKPYVREKWEEAKALADELADCLGRAVLPPPRPWSGDDDHYLNLYREYIREYRHRLDECEEKKLMRTAEKEEAVEKEYPTLEKLKEKSTEREALEGFLTWLRREGIVLARWDKGGNVLESAMLSDEELVFGFLGVDKAKVEEERRRLIASMERGGA